MTVMLVATKKDGGKMTAIMNRDPYQKKEGSSRLLSNGRKTARRHHEELQRWTSPLKITADILTINKKEKGKRNFVSYCSCFHCSKLFDAWNIAKLNTIIICLHEVEQIHKTMNTTTCSKISFFHSGRGPNILSLRQDHFMTRIYLDVTWGSNGSDD